MIKFRSICPLFSTFLTPLLPNGPPAHLFFTSSLIAISQSEPRIFVGVGADWRCVGHVFLWFQPVFVFKASSASVLPWKYTRILLFKMKSDAVFCHLFWPLGHRGSGPGQILSKMSPDVEANGRDGIRPATIPNHRDHLHREHQDPFPTSGLRHVVRAWLSWTSSGDPICASLHMVERVGSWLNLHGRRVGISLYLWCFLRIGRIEENYNWGDFIFLCDWLGKRREHGRPRSCAWRRRKRLYDIGSRQQSRARDIPDFCWSGCGSRHHRLDWWWNHGEVL